MPALPEPKPTAAATGQPIPSPLQQAVDQAIADELVARYRDTTPLPLVGAAPPVAQPGRPPMSQRATDASALMLAGGAATVMVGAGASLVMLTSGYADPAVCAIVLGAPAAVVLAVSRLVGKVKAAVESGPPTINQHYHGPVTQDSRSITSKTTGVIANTRNQHPN
ncbi:hypothetical protein ACFYPA_06240 [Streptomyces sp. NPDC005775]|uniref:hypothetical protein n=1 Tax=Streptomyces sp. NPDC005775 TaxID=3364729 RepID=UPI0036C2F42C